MRFHFIVAVVILAFASLAPAAFGDEPIFSGPQVGELIVPFEAQAVFGEDAGKKVNVLADVNDSPMLLVFVHQVTRPSIGLTRLIVNYAKTRAKDGLKSELVFLTKDPTETEAWIKRARRALPEGVSPFMSMDGIEGPGEYGLNRKMTLTVIVANKGKVVANFPLVQPSIQVDAPKIGHAIADALGGKNPPTLKDMGFDDRAMDKRKRVVGNPRQDGIYRKMMSPVIEKTATSEEVATAAKKVEEFATRHPWFKARVHKASNLIVGGGKLANYGTAEAQAYLRKWARELAPTDKNKPSPLKKADKANENGEVIQEK